MLILCEIGHEQAAHNGAGNAFHCRRAPDAARAGCGDEEAAVFAATLSDSEFARSCRAGEDFCGDE